MRMRARERERVTEKKRDRWEMKENVTNIGRMTEKERKKKDGLRERERARERVDGNNKNESE